MANGSRRDLTITRVFDLVAGLDNQVRDVL
jgi:hypothetical protein